MSWRKLKKLVQSMGNDGHDFEKLVAELLGLLLEIRFKVEKSGYQPRGDAVSEDGTIVIQTKKYTNRRINRKEIVGDIDEAYAELPDLQFYVLAASRTIDGRLPDRLNNVAEKKGLDIITLELTNSLSGLGALCVTFWEDIDYFFDSSDTSQQFLDWVKKERDKSKTVEKIEELKSKLKQGQQTQRQVQQDTKEYLLKRFGCDSNHDLRFNYPIDLSKAVERESLESKIAAWWGAPETPVCYLEGEEGMGKSWLAAKCVNSICTDENIVTFWLDSNRWNSCRSLDDLLQVCLETIPGYQDEKRIIKLKNKIRNIWWPPTLIVLDGVNEGKAVEAARRILGEYFTHKNELENRILFLFSTRPLDTYRNFEHNLWDGCDEIAVGIFNDTELQEALSREGLQLNDLPNSLKGIAKIPRYLQTCIRLRGLFGSFDNVTKEMVLWADLLYKIKHTDPQVRKKFDWQDIEEAQQDLAKLAQEVKWTNVDSAPHASLQLLIDCFPNYHEIRRDLEEQRIALKARKRQAELSVDHILLGWAIHLSNIFDSTRFSDVESLFERFQQELEPIPSEDLRTRALFVALQISAISPSPDIPQDQLSQKRAALMFAWFKSHNVQITNKQLSFWTKEDPDAYTQVIEFEFEYRNPLNYEEALIEPLAKTWLDKEGQIDRLASRLKKWFQPTYNENAPEDFDHIHISGQRLPRKRAEIQSHLLNAAFSILSQRPDPQFLEPLARCYGVLRSNAKSRDDLSRLMQFDKYLGKLMRWGYTERVLDDLGLLAEQDHADEILLKGVDRLKAHLDGIDLPRFNTVIDRIRNHERLLTQGSPETNANCWYHGLDCLAIRKDLHGLCDEDQDEIRRILNYFSTSTEPKLSRGLLPWIARYDPEGYSGFACNFKLHALDLDHPSHMLDAIKGLIFQQNDCERITDAILEMKQCLTQGDDSTLERTHLLTDILLFSASEDKLIDWFEFLAVHKPLRVSICYETTSMLLKRLLPGSIVTMAQQKLEALGPSTPDNQSISDDESKEVSELEYWSALYGYGTEINEEAVMWAFEELRLKKPDSIATYPLLQLALSDPKRFLDEILTDEKVRKHLFCKNSIRLIVSIYEGKDVPSYETLIPLLPLEIVGSFLCQPDRCNDLSRWGKGFMARMCSILKGDEVNRNSVEELRFTVNGEVLKIWAEQDTEEFLQLANKYLTKLSESPWYCQELGGFTDTVFCLLLRFQPDKARQYYRQWNVGNGVTQYKATNFLHQLWQIEHCNSSEHRQFRRELLEACLNDEEIMFMSLMALAWGGKKELWNLVTKRYLKSDYAKKRNLGVSILPWFGTCDAIKELERLTSDDQSKWVRDHATWAYEVAQQERSCQETYQEALQTRNLFRISAVFEQIEPALLLTAQRWHYEIEKKEGLHSESQEVDPKLLALLYRFWDQWENSLRMKSNFEVFGRKLREYCRGEKLPAIQVPRIAPWWKPTSDYDSL